MSEHTDNHIGARLKKLRKLHYLSQRDLAEAAGVSLSSIRGWEQGAMRSMRAETARKLATALHVPTTRLLGVSPPGEEAGTTTVEKWEPLRRAIMAPPSDEDTELEEPTVAGLRDAVEAAEPLFSAGHFTELGGVLPTLIRDAEAVAGSDPQGQALRCRLMQISGCLMTQTRQFDAAEVAFDRAMNDADDRITAATVAYYRCWPLLRQGRFAETMDLAARWADEVEQRMSRSTTEELAICGGLWLRVAAGAVRDARDSEAEKALRLAQSAAVLMGREQHTGGDYVSTFGPSTVAIKRAEAAAVREQPDRVLRMAERIPVMKLPVTLSNQSRHLLDVADAYARTRQYGEAVDVLQGIRVRAPEWLPYQVYARDIMGRVIDGRRTLTPEMRELADVVGVPL